MSNKAWKNIDPLDKLIRQTARCGMTDGTVMMIEFISGFEKFNTRPYHNYETWSQGYCVRGLGVSVGEEDLDDAIKEWARLVTLKREGGNVPRWMHERCKSELSVKLLEDWIATPKSD